MRVRRTLTMPECLSAGCRTYTHRRSRNSRKLVSYFRRTRENPVARVPEKVGACFQQQRAKTPRFPHEENGTGKGSLLSARSPQFGGADRVDDPVHEISESNCGGHATS